MTEPSPDRFEQAELVIGLTRREDGAVVQWIGASDARDADVPLRRFLSRAASRCVGRPTTVDFRRLEYMSSTTVSVLLAFLRQLDELEIETTVLYDASVHWQRVNFGSIKAVARSLRCISVEPA